MDNNKNEVLKGKSNLKWDLVVSKKPGFFSFRISKVYILNNILIVHGPDMHIVLETYFIFDKYIWTLYINLIYLRNQFTPSEGPAEC